MYGFTAELDTDFTGVNAWVNQCDYFEAHTLWLFALLLDIFTFIFSSMFHWISARLDSVLQKMYDLVK